jgi:hypothetical protein
MANLLKLSALLEVGGGVHARWYRLHMWVGVCESEERGEGRVESKGASLVVVPL